MGVVRRRSGATWIDAVTQERIGGAWVNATTTTRSGGSWTTPPPPPPPGSRPFFQTAHWLWNPIPTSPVLHATSATWSSALAIGAHVCNLSQFGSTLIPPTAITPTTPRYDVTFTQPWGSDPFGSFLMPIPEGTPIPPGSDGHVCCLDPTTGQSFSLWQAVRVGPLAWRASWGGRGPINGDGIDTVGGSTAGNLARYAGVVGIAELQAAVAANTGLNHALFFSSNMSGSGFVYPCKKSDGNSSTNPPEGTRVQLDPAVNVNTLPGITAGEKVIAKTLQTHGAYLADSGGARMAFIFEYRTNGLSLYSALGLPNDYFNLTHIPWSGLRVLRHWNGLATLSGING